MAVLLTSCGSCALSDETHNIQAPTDERARALLESAASAWTEAGCPIVIGTEGATMRFVAPEQLPCRERNALCEGHWDRDDQVLWLRNDKGDRELEVVLRHELGHMLGFRHRDYGIMQPSALNERVTPADCDETLH